MILSPAIAGCSFIVSAAIGVTMRWVLVGTITDDFHHFHSIYMQRLALTYILIQNLYWVGHVLQGTFFWNCIMRLLGVTIGEHSYIDTYRLLDWNLITIGDHVCRSPRALFNVTLLKT